VEEHPHDDREVGRGDDLVAVHVAAPGGVVVGAGVTGEGAHVLDREHAVAVEVGLVEVDAVVGERGRRSGGDEEREEEEEEEEGEESAHGGPPNRGGLPDAANPRTASSPY
jgi:hypothetical protein